MANIKTHDRIQKLIELICKGLYEKDAAIRLGLLTALAGESMFMLGAPGCAKSMVTRRIKEAFAADGDEKIKYFETLLNQFTTPEEVFGNISLKALNGELDDAKGKEEYRRLTEGFLPEADVAFLDEIWKASPAILNTLLTIVNERKFHNGSNVMDVPLKGLFAASNELPAKNKGLEALYDRFIFRILVDFIQNEEDFFEMIDSPSKDDFSISDEDKKLLITNNELIEWADEIDNKVKLSKVSKDVISAIRKEMILQNNQMSEEDKANGEMFEIGDRRWKKIAHILKTSAFLNDREEVDLMDCSLIENCIWGTEKQQKKAREIVEKCLEENGISCDSAIEDIEDAIEDFDSKIIDEWYHEGVVQAAVTKQEDIIENVNNEDCYKCEKTDDSEIYYISLAEYKSNSYYDSSRYHKIYNSDKSNYSSGSYSKDGDSIRCDGEDFTVCKKTVIVTPEKRGLIKNKLSDIAHETKQKNFDKDNYLPIVDSINSEIEALKTQKANDEVPFKANLFADQSYNVTLVSKIDEAIHQLEDAKINLDKKRTRYYNSQLNATLFLGDVILKNGSVWTAAEINNLTTEQKSNVIAVVCIVGEKTYAIGVNQCKDKWDKLKDYRNDYGKNLPSEYANNWLVPNKDLLLKIWENRKVINASLKAIGKTALDVVEYWSYSENQEEKSAYFQMFDDSGKQDHTTKGHEYKICVIREWQKI